ncbi:hypothetical protein [Pedobacter jejuensis]|uniref:Uncharacterized protein n=1 Tax=Pedobacter jejuensis TaxID=1268550 RepID=A0A3N0BUM3_9SPHI|nr:hypothetical protein [Pedobacter jejuensis]RNL53040.1 hypothetical protein D7004_10790 [Pedobacter jejuensis]
MKTIENSIDNLEQILEALASQGKDLADDIKTLINTKPDDNSDEIERILLSLNDVKAKLDFENLKAMLMSLNRKIEKVPYIIPVTHHHHLDRSSKGLVVGIFSGLLFIAVLTGLTAYLLNRNASLALNSDKLLYLRAYNPEYLNRVDLAFVSARDSLVKVAEEKIIHLKQLQEAELSLKNKEAELKKARLFKQKLQKRKPSK